MAPKRVLAIVMIAVAVVSYACRGGTSAPVAPTSASHVSATCTLTATSGLKTMSIGSRTYELHVPAAVSSGHALPLLVSLHGTGANGAIQSAITHWTSFSDSLGPSSFLVVFPDGLSTLWLWGAEKSYDVTFIFEVIDALRASGCVDTSRIYVDGWSEGAYMAQRMACADGDPSVDNLGVVFSGVHGYAGGNPELGAGCTHLAHAPTVLLSQGLDDAIIDPARVGFPAFQAWGKRYSCAPSSRPLTAPQQLSGCANGAQVAWWPITGQGHLVWSCSMDPTWHNRGVWAFFTQHQAPAESTCG